MYVKKGSTYQTKADLLAGYLRSLLIYLTLKSGEEADMVVMSA